MKKGIVFLITTFFITSTFAQADKYKYVDDAVAKIGALPTLNVAQITEKITATFSSNEDKARAIYYWIANNIEIDPAATKKNDVRNTEPEKVILARKATPLSFSLLFQEMCSDVKIRCLSVDGYVKNFASEINEKPDEKNYSWNVVQLGQSPQTWYYVDACRASGYLDNKQTKFTKSFTSQFFFADKKLFNLMYFPDNMAWQLGDATTKSLTGYYALPVISNYAMALEMNKPMPLTGFIKTKINVKNNFSFNINNENTVNKISLLIGDYKKQPKEIPMNFDNNSGQITFAYEFKKEETFPLRITIDGKVVLEYMVEVLEK
jgi:transglutaminase/protease-like cytokinesis protein 3